MKIKKGDKVHVIAGKDKGKQGTVAKALPKEEKVIVDGINRAKKHLKATKQEGERGHVAEVPMPIHVSNVKKVK